MEKNPRVSVKNNNLDAKVKDVSNKHLKVPRVKESISPRPDSRRKPNPQKHKELSDKRPKSKNIGVWERYRSEVTEDYVDESVYFSCKQGSKKNYNHLLNFHLSHLQIRDVNSRRSTFNKFKHQKFNKELFLQANYQFIARDNGNYTVHEKNPDVLVDWSLIEEIRLPSHEVPSCPICLYSPVAAKITRCGHIYCWPCILHYLALTDRSWQKCPICFEAVHKTDLKSVSWNIRKVYHTRDEITMCLMKRVKGSLFSTPVTHESPEKVCSVNSDEFISRFQKLLLADKNNIQDIIGREHSELNEAYKKEKDTPEACFIESALKLLEERENYLHLQSEMAPEDKKQVFQSEAVCNEGYRRIHYESISSTDSHEEISDSDYLDLKNSNYAEGACSQISSIPESPLDSEKKDFYYFYQAEDGQFIYLNNLNVRMLVKEYGALENAPPIIKAKIVDIESVSMTEALRKRLRYLQHLPLTCEFQVVELNFSHILEKATLLQFEGEINKRKHFRNRKARDERRREKFIEMEENKKLGKYPQATYNLQSADQFPSCFSSDFQPLTPPKHGNGIENLFASSTASPELPINEDNSNQLCTSSSMNENAATSFAQKLRDGPKIFTQVVKEKKKEPIEDQAISDRNVDSDDGFLPPPVYQNSLGDAIKAALDSATFQDGSNQNSRKKKKGKKQQVLFSTSMCRKN